MIHPHHHQELGKDWNWDGETITKASGFLFQLSSSSFLVAFQILLQVLLLLRELTVKLQMQASDVVYAYSLIKKVISLIQSLRNESEKEFRKQFLEAEKIGKKLHGDDFQLTIPRLTGRQRNRSNPPVSSPEEYYRITVYNEFLSHILAELKERFINNPSHDDAVGLLHLLPSHCASLASDEGVPEDLAKAVDHYKEDLPSAAMFSTEYFLWVRQWKNEEAEVPATLSAALKECTELAYPNITTLLKLAVTLPITSCESERSFSQLKLIKTARRSTMGESRLSSLALMKINRDRCNELLSEENMKELIKSFSQKHPRRIKLSHMLVED